ncbi:MAG: phage holin family protein [Thermoleophilia bacterium]|jgi:uncharacterized membrane protein YvlD (DUF360 family)
MNRKGKRFFIKRLLVVWAITTLSLLLIAYILPGLWFHNFASAAGAAALIGILNAVLWPALVSLTMPLSVLTFGAFTLVLNGLIIWLAAQLDAGMSVSGIGTAIVTAIGLAAINTLFCSLLSIDDDESYFRNVLQRKVRRKMKPQDTDVPGVLFLEIDGLSRSVLIRALRNGCAPTLYRWLQQGSHRLAGWECDLSSQTAASQAGILLGNNFNIPAFRWYEKETGRVMVASQLGDIAEMESRQSRGDGLLINGGLSLSNMFSGDTAYSFFTMSKAREKSDFQKNSFYFYLVDPYNFLRGFMLAFWDLILELRSERRQRTRDIKPRLDHRARTYPVVRAATTTILRELSIYTLIGEMFAGFPVAYVTLFGYDEVAHHSGVEREDALEVLRKLDQQFARLETAARRAPRPYSFVILSDHGQSQGATFKQRYDLTLEDLVRQLLAGRVSVQAPGSVDEHWSYLSTPLTDAVTADQRNIVARVLRRAVKSRTRNGDVVLGPERKQLRETKDAALRNDEDVIVMASGNLGLVYFKAWKQRKTMEQINQAFPGFLEGLTQHPGIGFVMVRSEQHGPVALGAQGICYLDDGKVEGEDPLADFGPNAAVHLRRTDGFPHVADIMINSFYDPASDEVAAFEELIGSHGGLGGDQSKPFVLFPSEWEIPEKEIVGAEQLHAQMKQWLKVLQGQDIDREGTSG